MRARGPFKKSARNTQDISLGRFLQKHQLRRLLVPIVRSFIFPVILGRTALLWILLRNILGSGLILASFVLLVLRIVGCILSLRRLMLSGLRLLLCVFVIHAGWLLQGHFELLLIFVDLPLTSGISQSNRLFPSPIPAKSYSGDAVGRSSRGR